jgi:protein required for attachment to host cells
MKTTKLWVMIADGGRARVLLNTGPGTGLAALPELIFHVDLPRSHDLGADRPGRTHESQGQMRHAIEPHADPHTKLKHGFIAGLVAMLEAKSKAREFDTLALVAPPAIIGQFRSLLSDRVKRSVVAEIEKDLTKIPNDEAAFRLGELLRL